MGCVVLRIDDLVVGVLVGGTRVVVTRGRRVVVVVFTDR